MKPVKKFANYVLRYLMLADMFINKLTFFTEWFQMQEEFKTPFEEMSPIQLNKCLQKFYLSARKRDGSYYNKKSLIAIRAALDRHLKSPPFSKPFSIVGDSHFNEANKSLSNFLKTLSKSGQITPTVHKQAPTTEIVEKFRLNRQSFTCENC